MNPNINLQQNNNLKESYMMIKLLDIPYMIMIKFYMNNKHMKNRD